MTENFMKGPELAEIAECLVRGIKQCCPTRTYKIKTKYLSCTILNTKIYDISFSQFNGMTAARITMI